MSDHVPPSLLSPLQEHPSSSHHKKISINGKQRLGVVISPLEHLRYFLFL